MVSCPLPGNDARRAQAGEQVVHQAENLAWWRGEKEKKDLNTFYLWLSSSTNGHMRVCVCVCVCLPHKAVILDLKVLTFEHQGKVIFFPLNH